MAAMPKPAAIPARGPNQRDAPLGLAAAAAGAAAAGAVALFCVVEPVAAATCAGCLSLERYRSQSDTA